MRGLLAALVPLTALLAAGAAEPAPSRPGQLPEGWYADVDTTLGTFTIRLFPEQAPQTVADFVAFAEGRMEYADPFTGEKVKRPFYDGLKIHRVHFQERFEAGDPTGTSRGAPPVWVPKESGRYDFSASYRVGMTAATMKRISGVLFFVSVPAQPYLNAGYNCFGEVVRGRDTVDRIVRVRTDENNVPLEAITIEHVRIQKIGNPPPIPEPVPYTPPVPELKALTPGGAP